MNSFDEQERDDINQCLKD